MVLYILRGSFILLATCVAALYVLPFQAQLQVDYSTVVLMLGGAVAIGAAIVAIDVATRQKRLSAVSGVFLGLIAGLIAAYALSFVVDLVGLLTAPDVRLERPAATPLDVARLSDGQRMIYMKELTAWRNEMRTRESYLQFLEGVKVFLGLITCYLGISLVIQTKDDFRFVLPYVEFAKEHRGQRPTLLDTSVLIDGRVLDVVRSGLIGGGVVVPRFVVDELQRLADSADRLKRERGRRGLEVLERLRESSPMDVRLDDSEPTGWAGSGDGVDAKLVSLAQGLRGRVMTNDVALKQVAGVRGVEALSLHDLAEALRPPVMAGESLTVQVVRAGESAGQGVGYLADGTMVVVEGGRDAVGGEAEVEVSRTLQTNNGRMVFGRLRDASGGTDESTHGGDGRGPDTTAAVHQKSSSQSGGRRNPRRGG